MRIDNSDAFSNLGVCDCAQKNAMDVALTVTSSTALVLWLISPSAPEFKAHPITTARLVRFFPEIEQIATTGDVQIGSLLL